MKEKKDNRMAKGMMALYLLLTIVVGVAIVLSIVKISFVHGDEWRERGERREAGLRDEPARRGNIYSSDGKILATTVTECDFYVDLFDTVAIENGRQKLDRKGRPVESGPIVDSNFTKYLDTVCQMLHVAFPNKSVQGYKDRLLEGRAKQRRCFLVQRGVPYSVWLSICRLPGWNGGVVKSVNYRSVVKQVRAHIYGNLAENTIGFRNTFEANTYTGLEGYYDSILRGQDGLYNCRRLTKGIWLPYKQEGQVAVPQRTDAERMDTVVLKHKIDGKSIVSTIDTRYQDIAESSLRNALRQYGGQAGCAILMEMQTGYVLACVNLAVDTSAHDYLEVRDRNIAVSDVYEPGSTFKTVILSAILGDSTVDVDTSMRLRAAYKNFGGKYGEIRDDHVLNGRDTLTLKEVIEQSSNVGMSELGWQFYSNRRDRLGDLVKRMFPYGNMNPDVKAPEYKTYVNNLNASNRDFLNFCYGYSTRVSALQLVTFYNALGAKGRMVKPLFCKAIIDENGKEHVMPPIVLKEHVVNARTANLMHDMLEGVVERGTGNNIKNNTYGIAGKTGTAVHSYRDKRRYNASFAGFFPSENPRYTCIVMLEDIPYYGRQAALVFKAISDCVVAVDKRLSDGAVRSAWPKLEQDSSKLSVYPFVAKGKQDEISSLSKRLGIPYNSVAPNSTWVSYRPATELNGAQYEPYSPTPGRVPNCTGMTAKDAIELLHSAGYKVKINGYGKVRQQSPVGNTAARKGTIVTLNLR